MKPKNYDDRKVYLMHVGSGSVDTKDNWYAEYKEMGAAEWFGFLDDEEMQEKCFEVEEHCWEENLEEVVWDDEKKCLVER